MSFPLPNPCGPRRQAQPSCGVKAGKSSPISLTVKKKGQKPQSREAVAWGWRLAGAASPGAGSPVELPTTAEQTLLPGCSWRTAAEVECDTPDFSRKFPAD